MIFSSCSGPRARAQQGFTLIELLIVVIILAVLAAIVVPQIMTSTRDADIAAARMSLRAIRTKVDEHQQLYGEWPENIAKSWFMGYRLPQSPWKPLHKGEAANVVVNPAVYHPAAKLTHRHAHPYFYNNQNGAVMIRIPEQSSQEESVRLYNLVNSASIRVLGQTTQQ